MGIEFSEGNEQVSGIEQTARWSARVLPALGTRVQHAAAVGLVVTIPVGRHWRWAVVERIGRRGVDVVYTTDAAIARALGKPPRFYRTRLPKRSIFEAVPGSAKREAHSIRDIFPGGQVWLEEQQ